MMPRIKLDIVCGCKLYTYVQMLCVQTESAETLMYLENSG
jgi:hypothetical protein